MQEVNNGVANKNKNKNKKTVYGSDTNTIRNVGVMQISAPGSPSTQNIAPGSPVSMGTIERMVEHPENYANSNSELNTTGNSNKGLTLNNFAMGWFEDIPLPEKFVGAPAARSANSSIESVHNTSLPWWTYISPNSRPIPIRRKYATYKARRSQRRRRRNTRKH